LGTETHLSAQISEKRTQFTHIALLPISRENPPIYRDAPLLERFRPTTENRGVPGSSPGLAMLDPA
jgi:hypothetical protein